MDVLAYCTLNHRILAGLSVLVCWLKKRCSINFCEKTIVIHCFETSMLLQENVML
jgi:hypothetical protein